MFAAELGLSGDLRPVKGLLTILLTAINHKLDGIIISADNLQEAQVFLDLNSNLKSKLKIIAAQSLAEVLNNIFQKWEKYQNNHSKPTGNQHPSQQFLTAVAWN